MLASRQPAIRIHESRESLYRHAADAVAGAIRSAVHANGRCSIALSGGGTPVGLHRALATEYRDDVPWAGVHVFWCDERYVPHDDERSNFGMGRRTLVDHVPLPPGNVYPMPTSSADPNEAALEYEATLRRHFSRDLPRFDVMILGLGEDGHTASLFPASPALLERKRWVLAVTTDAEVPSRLTLTLPVLTRAAESHVLVTGGGKSDAVRKALSAGTDPVECPAAALRHSEGRITWWLDAEAAERLDDSQRAQARVER
jgi:6-phosphogluconolactonase